MQQFWVGVGFAAVFICFLMYSINKGRDLNSGQHLMLQILTAICASIGGALISGEALFSLSRAVPGGKLTVSGTAGFVIFFVVWFTFPKPEELLSGSLNVEKELAALQQEKIPLRNPTISVHCPECKRIQQSLPFDRVPLQELLNSGEHIRATCAGCGYTWNLTSSERARLRGAFP